MPSDVDASPIVQKQTSLPLLLRSFNSARFGEYRNSFDARAKPMERGICPAVGASPAAIFFWFTKSTQLPFPSTTGVQKWEFICLPPLCGSCDVSGSAYQLREKILQLMPGQLQKPGFDRDNIQKENLPVGKISLLQPALLLYHHQIFRISPSRQYFFPTQ
jgi:hypothetical protein